MAVEVVKSILVVCLGNICRSPTGEAVLRKKAQQLALPIAIDSAGTIGFHQGKKPDARSRSAAERRGYVFDGIVSRQIGQKDFEEFDLILAADNDNMEDLMLSCPKHYQHKIKLFLSYSESSYTEIPDPYYGGEQGFELVLDLIEDATDKILASIQK